jgi:hypothetical protein
MFGPHWYHSSIKKNLTAFASLFNSIEVLEYNADGTEKERITVPIVYGPREAYLARAEQDPDLDKQVALTLPGIAFVMNGMSYDASRSKTMMQKNTIDETSVRKSVFSAAPYNLDVTLHVLAKSESDAYQIVEQILPWFRPSFKFTLKSLPEMGFRDDVTVLLQSVEKNDNYESDWTERREINWTLQFQIKTNLYGPVREQGVILETQVDSHLVGGFGLDGEITKTEIDNSPRVERVTVTPDPETAQTEEEATGFIVTKEEFSDGKKYNPVTDEDEDIT